MGRSAALHVMRSRRLLRRFAEQARDEALPQVAAPHHPIVRARRGLGLLLSRRADGGQPPGAPRRGGGAPLLRAGRATLTWAPSRKWRPWHRTASPRYSSALEAPRAGRHRQGVGLSAR